MQVGYEKIAILYKYFANKCWTVIYDQHSDGLVLVIARLSRTTNKWCQAMHQRILFMTEDPKKYSKTQHIIVYNGLPWGYCPTTYISVTEISIPEQKNTVTANNMSYWATVC